MNSVLSFFLACVLFATSCSAYNSTVFYPYMDSYVDSANPTVNYGTSTTGLVYQDQQSQAQFNILVGFNITLAPTSIINARITYAVQYIDPQEQAFGPMLTTVAYLIPCTWTELGVVWNNAPANGASAIQSPYTSPYQDGDISKVIVPVGAALTSAISQAKPTFCVKIAGPLGTDAINVYMRESLLQTRPTLIVDY